MLNKIMLLTAYIIWTIMRLVHCSYRWVIFFQTILIRRVFISEQSMSTRNVYLEARYKSTTSYPKMITHAHEYTCPSRLMKKCNVIILAIMVMLSWSLASADELRFEVLTDKIPPSEIAEFDEALKRNNEKRDF